jgi:methylmalonyl-CoA mutase
MNAVADFAEDEGRRPRILVVKLGQGGGDHGLATAFADVGFDVDVAPSHQTPEEAARQAIENDVHLVGVSAQAAQYKTLAPVLIQALKDQGASDILVICGGEVLSKDYPILRKAGVAGIYRPNADIPAAEIVGMIRGRRPTN